MARGRTPDGEGGGPAGGAGGHRHRAPPGSPGRRAAPAAGGAAAGGGGGRGAGRAAGGSHRAASRRPLVLRYTFVAQAKDALPLGLFPVQPASSHAGAPERKTPLAITLPTDQTVDLTLESERPFGGQVVAGEEIAGAHRFQLTVTQTDDTLRVHARMVIPGGLIEPADYPAFAAWARAVEEAERLRLVIRTE
ncbi:MAG: hypothetical protein R3F43_15015 [bacterium]